MEQLNDNIANLTSAIDSLQPVATEASSMSAAEESRTAEQLANDPRIQRLVDAGVMKWSDIIQDKQDPALVSDAKLQTAVDRLQALENQESSQYQQEYAQYQKAQIMGYNRPIAGTPFTIWQPPKYAKSL